MTLKIVRNTTIIISLIVLIISLTQNAIIIDYNGIKIIPAIDYFFMGSMAIIGGGPLEWLIWLANPLCLYTILYLWKNNKKALVTCTLATILSTSFLFWEKIIGSESGSMGKIVSFEAGYYLWITSIVLLTIGTFYYFARLLKTEQKSLRDLLFKTTDIPK